MVSSYDLLLCEHQHLKIAYDLKTRELTEFIKVRTEEVCNDYGAEKAMFNLLALMREQVRQNELIINRLRKTVDDQSLIIVELGLPQKKKQK